MFGEFAVSIYERLVEQIFENSALNQDLGWCVDDGVDLRNAFEDTPCASTSCGVDTSSGCSGAAPGNGGGEVGYAPTYRPTQGPGSSDDS